jgi:hypothetical protein
MIPEELKLLVEKARNVKRTKVVEVEQALAELGVNPNSEFSEFYREYKITLFESSKSGEYLCDICEPPGEMAMSVDFAHKSWGLPDNFICFTSCEGEGGYLYDKNTGKIWDFSLATRQDFIDGKEQPRWDGFFEFMIWYLS